jgi:hypothetical protein
VVRHVADRLANLWGKLLRACHAVVEDVKGMNAGWMPSARISFRSRLRFVRVCSRVKATFSKCPDR